MSIWNQIKLTEGFNLKVVFKKSYSRKQVFIKIFIIMDELLVLFALLHYIYNIKIYP